MMKNKLYNVIQKLTSIGLSDTDRADMRTALAEHIDNNQPIRSPWTPILSPLQSVGKPAMVAAMILLMVGGVSMAAENSVPGDPLYAIKVNVNESLMDLASVSPTSEAAHESRLAARRIAELETLAARGNLNESISSDLTEAITEHTKLAREHIAEISSQGATGDAASLETELNSTLNTHSDILDDLAITNDGVRATTTASAAAKLRAVAQTKTEDDVSTAVSVTNMSQTQARNSTEDTGDTSKKTQLSPTQVERLLERTADRLQSAREEFSNNDITDTAVSESVEALLVTSAEMIDRAVDQIDEDNHSEADPLLRKALTYAHEASIIINTRRQLEISSGVDIESLLDNNTSAATSSSNATMDIEIKNSQDLQATSSSTSSASISDSQTEEGNDIMPTDISTSSVKGSSTKDLDVGTTGPNFTRQQGVSSDNDKRIDEVLERVQETLDSKSPQGLLPSRTSHEDNS